MTLSSFFASATGRQSLAAVFCLSVLAPFASAQTSSPPAAPSAVSIHAEDFTFWVGWTDNSADETGFEVQRATGTGSYAVIATVPANASGYRDPSVAQGAHYSYRVRAVRDGAYSDYSPVATAGMDYPLTSGWSVMDVGTTGPAGSNSGYVPTVTMNAGGADIFGTSDSFRFTFETWSGDGSVVARVTSLNNTNPWAKAGVMFRASLGAGSRNAAMLLTADNVCTFQARTEPGISNYTAGGTTSHNPGDYLRTPYWVKVSRVGDTFTGYVSPDGSAWTAISSQVITLPRQLYVGIAAASHASVQTVASFENVQVSVATTPPPPAEWAQQNLGVGSGGFTVSEGLTVSAAGGDIYDNTDSGVFVYRSWTGGGEFVTRVDSLAKSNDWAKAGIMLRATLAADSANVMVALTPDLGAVLQTRGASGGPSNTDTHDWNPSVPSWIKLLRQNGQLSASWSVDGATWHGIGWVSDTLPDTLFVGFAVSSHETATSTTATFSNFTFQ